MYTILRMLTSNLEGSIVHQSDRLSHRLRGTQPSNIYLDAQHGERTPLQFEITPKAYTYSKV